MGSLASPAAFPTTGDDFVIFPSGATIRKLTATNYESWKPRMQMILTKERLWPLVCQRKLRPEMASDDNKPPTKAQLEYDDEAERATATIFLCLSDIPLYHVMTLQNPVEIWARLKQLYTSVGFSTRFFIWRYIFNARAASRKDLAALIDNLRQWQSQLRDSGAECSEEILCGALLNALPEGFDTWVVLYTQEYREAKAVSFDDLTARLLDENRRLTECDLSPFGEKFVDGWC